METGHAFRIVGHYMLGAPIAVGGMGTVRFGRHVNLPRVVAVKQLRTELASDPSSIGMFEDEVQLLSRIRHKNVVAPIEFIIERGDYFLVMEYVAGESLARLLDVAKGPLPVPLACKVAGDVLAGLQAAHEALDTRGEPLGLVHRDVTPQNIVVGLDGDARILDFGVAKAARRGQVTEFGQLKGKLGYMAPEQLAFENVDARADLYAVGVVLWEMLVGKRLFSRPAESKSRFEEGAIPAPSSLVPHGSSEVDRVVLRALSRSPQQRYSDAREMADALISVVHPCRNSEVGDWVERLAHEAMAARRRSIQELEALPNVAPESRPLSTTPTSHASKEPNIGKAVAQAVADLGQSERPVSHDVTVAWRGPRSVRLRVVAGAALLAVATVPVWARYREQPNEGSPLPNPRHDSSLLPYEPTLPAEAAAPQPQIGAESSRGAAQRDPQGPAASQPFGSGAPTPSSHPGPMPRRPSSPGGARLPQDQRPETRTRDPGRRSSSERDSVPQGNGTNESLSQASPPPNPSNPPPPGTAAVSELPGGSEHYDPLQDSRRR